MVLLLCGLVPTIVPLASAQTSKDKYEKDLAKCRYEAMKHTQPALEVGVGMVLEKLHEEELILRCMEAKGYRRQLEEQPAASPAAPLAPPTPSAP